MNWNLKLLNNLNYLAWWNINEQFLYISHAVFCAFVSLSIIRINSLELILSFFLHFQFIINIDNSIISHSSFIKVNNTCKLYISWQDCVCIVLLTAFKITNISYKFKQCSLESNYEFHEIYSTLEDDGLPLCWEPS